MEQDLINSDPFSTGSPFKYLTGAKLKQGWQANIPCSAIKPFGDDAYVDQNDIRFTDGVYYDSGSIFDSGHVNYRGESFKLCTFRSADPTRAIVRAGGTNSVPSNKYLLQNAWYTNDNPNTIVGSCTHGSGYAGIYASPGASAPLGTDYFHQLFVSQNSCPAWAPKQDTGNLNGNCDGGTPSFLCGQKASDVLACCMGKKSTCRSDQKPQSRFCDAFMTEYCSKHKDAPQCKCMNVPDGAELTARVNIPPVCWYKGCENVNATYRTSAMTNVKCPPVNVCNIKNQIGEVAAAGLLNTIQLQTNCNTGTGEDGSTNIVDADDTGTTDLGSANTLTDVLQFVSEYPLQVGIGSIVLMLILLLLALI